MEAFIGSPMDLLSSEVQAIIDDINNDVDCLGVDVSVVDSDSGSLVTPCSSVISEQTTVESSTDVSSSSGSSVTSDSSGSGTLTSSSVTISRSFASVVSGPNCGSCEHVKKDFLNLKTNGNPDVRVKRLILYFLVL